MNISDHLRSMIHLQKLKIHLDTRSPRRFGSGWDPIMWDDPEVAALVPKLFESCSSAELTVVEVLLPGNDNTQSITWTRCDSSFESGPTQWNVDEWKFDWPKKEERHIGR